MPNLGYMELLVIGAVALLLFGAKKIPEVAKAIGQSVNAFKNGLKEGAVEEKSPAAVEPPKTPLA